MTGHVSGKNGWTLVGPCGYMSKFFLWHGNTVGKKLVVCVCYNRSRSECVR